MQRTLLATLVLASLVTLAHSPRVEAIQVVSVGSATAAVGDTFTIPVSVSGATDLMAFQFDLSYDSTIVTALSFTDVGTDFATAATAGGGVLTGITGFLSPGLLSGVADSMSGALTGQTGSGVLVNIEFLALAPGVSRLMLSGVFLDFSDQGVDAVVNGQGGVVPEPGTGVLLASGLGLLAVLGLARRGRRNESVIGRDAA